MDTNEPKKKFFRVIDIAVLVVFLSTAVWGLYLFRQDLMRTLEERDADPAGFVIIRDNIVQRRHDDRVLWDRLFSYSNVYSGDLIRAADLSSALIFVGDNELFLGENTLIRIQYDARGGGPVQVELREGRLNITGGSSEDGQEVFLEYMGNQIQAGRGSVLDAQIIANAIAVHVSEGTASFVSDGQAREITKGQIVAMDETGAEIDTQTISIKFSPLRFFRAETLASLSASVRESVSGAVREVITASETAFDTVREFVETAIEIPPAQPALEPETITVPGQSSHYTVQPGDTLAKIAGKVYGNNLFWRRILDANTDVIKDQDLIFPGQVFVIP